MIGQTRQVDLEPLFAYELCAVPCALIDGWGCLRKSSKSALVKRLGVVDISPSAASMHALSGCDTTSYPYGKGKEGALNKLLAGTSQDFLMF
ncbi:hypothetical protein DPMN_085414 [Dreissena polymorpha]|uniref:Uncharacterized protein n=1 Tax=Dreissena polymorpha TaxID=45954 RepID=A0A9D3YDP2_DREPO|nr:hypothetical protein DPMN_085414 [Dreissena polymorpha]